MSKEKQIEELSDDIYTNCPVYLLTREEAKMIARFVIEEQGYREQEWISVDERLPEQANNYLTVSEEGIHIRFYSKEWGWNRDYGYVFYWMPLPEAPKMKGDAE